TEPTVIAWIYGGILSTGQAIVTSGETFASNYLFKVIVEPAETCIGDLDHNGIVDGADLAIVLAYWGKVTQPKRAIADLNDDGIVNAEDLAIMLGDWGPCQ
ncbi:MAG: dockerin type I domain-containing protein, partial [Phycisphaerales bacterium]